MQVHVLAVGVLWLKSAPGRDLGMACLSTALEDASASGHSFINLRELSGIRNSQLLQTFYMYTNCRNSLQNVHTKSLLVKIRCVAGLVLIGWGSLEHQ